jgi:glycosyltransferase involved in cell wall biosynthesis
LVGPLDDRFTAPQQKVAQLGLRDRVHFLGAIDDAALQRQYRHAAALVMPSRYEGFGLPAIEAMHHGIPVVAADAAALPDTVGDAGLLFPPEDATALTQALLRVLHEQPLRQRLTEAGYRHVQNFSLLQIGSAYLDLVDRLARGVAGVGDEG